MRMKKAMSGILAAACLLATVPAVSLGATEASAETAEKKLNVYVIAGQSNAVGYSKAETVTSSRVKTEYKTGFDNAYYYSDGEGVKTKTLYSKVKFGGGLGADRFGAEVGMADSIARLSDDGADTLIVKYAWGASYLVDSLTLACGNWVPPSMPRVNSNLSGKLYKAWKQTVTDAYAMYEEAGYTDINFKGTFWMQGCAESDGTYRTKDYKGHLKALIGDMRNDLSAIFGTEKAAETKAAPFVIGTLCPTFVGGNGGGVAAIRKIQDEVAAEVDNVYLSETDDYVIVDPSTGAPAAGCIDQYHFNGNDMLSLGLDVGEKLVFGGNAHCLVYTEGKGTADKGGMILKAGQTASVTFSSEEHYYLKKLTYDGQDVTASVVNNVYTITDVEGKHELRAEFAEHEKYNISTEYDKKGGTVKAVKSGKMYAGEQATYRVTAKEGYTLKSVKFNGTEITAGTDGRYTITVVEGENKLVAEFEKIGSTGGETGGETGGSDSTENGGNGGETGGDNTATEEKSGCGGAVGVSSAAVLTAVAGAAVAVSKKRRK